MDTPHAVAVQGESEMVRQAIGFDLLPDELLYHILSLVPIPYIVFFGRVSSRFCSVSLTLFRDHRLATAKCLLERNNNRAFTIDAKLKSEVDEIVSTLKDKMYKRHKLEDPVAFFIRNNERHLLRYGTTNRLFKWKWVALEALVRNNNMYNPSHFEWIRDHVLWSLMHPADDSLALVRDADEDRLPWVRLFLAAIKGMNARATEYILWLRKMRMEMLGAEHGFHLLRWCVHQPEDAYALGLVKLFAQLGYHWRHIHVSYVLHKNNAVLIEFFVDHHPYLFEGELNASLYAERNATRAVSALNHTNVDDSLIDWRTMVDTFNFDPRPVLFHLFIFRRTFGRDPKGLHDHEEAEEEMGDLERSDHTRVHLLMRDMMS